MNKESLKKVFLQIKNSGKILLTLHPDPDPDSICSNVALLWILRSLGIKATLIGGDNFSKDKFPYLKEFTKEIQNVSFANYKEPFDTFVVLDISRPARISNKIQSIEGMNVIVIDHHAGNSFSSTENCTVYLDTKASSTCEILMDLIGVGTTLSFRKHLLKLDPSIYKALYMGIWSDTSGFTLATTPRTLMLASCAMDFAKQKEVATMVQNHEKSWDLRDITFLPEISKKAFFYQRKNFHMCVCVYENSMDIKKVLDLLSKTEALLIVVAQKQEKKYAIEIISSFDAELLIAKNLAEKLNGSGHANRAGGQLPSTYSGRELLQIIHEKIDEVL